jgi:hypothetical protein
MPSRQEREDRRYYKAMFAEHGVRMFCPICDARPCIPGCRLGYETEDELLKLSVRLERFDKPKRKKKDGPAS